MIRPTLIDLNPVELTNSIVKYVIQIKIVIIVNVNVSMKSIKKCKNDYSWNPSICICEKNRYLKSINDTSVITCNEIMSQTVCQQMWQILYQQISQVSTNFDNKKVRQKMDYHILNTFLLAIILLSIIMIYYHYAKHRSKQKNNGTLTIQKWRKNELKKVGIKNSTCYYFHDIIKIEDFNFDILLDQKPLGNIFIYDIW